MCDKVEGMFIKESEIQTQYNRYRGGFFLFSPIFEALPGIEVAREVLRGCI